MFVKFNLCIRVGNWLVAQMVGGNGRRAPFGAFNTSQWGSGTARAEFSHPGKILRSGALRSSYFKIIIVWKPNSRAHGPALKRNPLAPRPKKIIFFCVCFNLNLIRYWRAASGLSGRGRCAKSQFGQAQKESSDDQFPRQRRKKQTNYARSAKVGSEHSR